MGGFGNEPALAAAGLDPERLPRHVAVIMDGNGRWAKRRGWRRILGHRQGATAVRTITTEAARLGIERLTLYAFSSENWNRPQEEIDALMTLLTDFLRDEEQTLIRENIRLEAIGRLHLLPEKVRRALDDVIHRTAANHRMVLCLALSYGGRDEIVDACRTLARQVAAGELDADAIDAESVSAHLYAPHSPDVDLMIRSAGELRVSNFLLWQSHYAEYVSAAPLWPDFGPQDLIEAVRTYQSRHRRFGRVMEPA